jgi:hypothetical protein
LVLKKCVYDLEELKPGNILLQQFRESSCFRRPKRGRALGALIYKTGGVSETAVKL